MLIKVRNLKTFYNKIFVGYNCISSQIIFSKLPKWQFSKITISAYVNLLRVIDHKIKNPSIRTKHNLLSSNQSKVTTVGYGGGRVNVSSSTKYYRMLGLTQFLSPCLFWQDCLSLSIWHLVNNILFLHDTSFSVWPAISKQRLDMLCLCG